MLKMTKKFFILVSPSHLSTLTSNVLRNTYQTGHSVMRKWELIKQSKLLKIKSKIFSDLFYEKYRLKFGEFNNTFGTEKVNHVNVLLDVVGCRPLQNCSVCKQRLEFFITRWFVPDNYYHVKLYPCFSSASSVSQSANGWSSSPWWWKVRR